MIYQALYRKWRPRTFDEVVGQSHITETLKRQTAQQHLSHAYLFTGTRGTGKTTCAKILARAANCESPVGGNPCNRCSACLGIEDGSILDVLELDAASNNGVDQVRALRDEAVYSPASVKKRVYIIDEVHMLTVAAFNALLKILEEPPEHLMFILATTELHKVPATIKSRCQQFAFKRIPAADIAGRLRYVAGEEKLPLTGEGAALLARLADGGMRDALSLLDQCASSAEHGRLGEPEILNALGLAGNAEIAGWMAQLAARDAGAALERLDRLYAAGKSVESMLGELAALARDLLIRAAAPRSGSGLMTGGYDEATLQGLSESMSAPRLAQILSRLQRTAAGLARSTNRRVDAELCLLRLCDETLDDSSEGLSARVSRLEELISAAPPRPGSAPARGDGSIPPLPEPRRRPPAEARSEAFPPPWEDAPPPWETEPPPERGRDLPAGEGGRAAGPDQPDALPEPAPEAAQVGNFWPGMVSGLKGKIPMGEYSFLCDPAAVQGAIAGGVLTLWVKDDFTRRMIGKPGILAAVERAASLLPGAPYRAAVAVGTPPSPPPAREARGGRDALDSLLALKSQYGNIIKEE